MQKFIVRVKWVSEWVNSYGLLKKQASPCQCHMAHFQGVFTAVVFSWFSTRILVIQTLCSSPGPLITVHLYPISQIRATLESKYGTVQLGWIWKLEDFLCLQYIPCQSLPYVMCFCRCRWSLLVLVVLVNQLSPLCMYQARPVERKILTSKWHVYMWLYTWSTK